MLVDITSRKGYHLIQQYLKEFAFIVQKEKEIDRHGASVDNVFAYTNVNMQEAKKKLSQELRRTKNVSVVGLACTEITNLSIDELQNILITNNGCIQIMFMDPDKEEIKKREKIEKGENIKEYEFPSVVRYNHNRFLASLKTIKEQNHLDDKWYQNHVKIGKYNFQPSINCIMTDEYVFVHYYGIKHCGMDVPSFAICKSIAPSIYEYYKNYIEEYWKGGETYG